MDCLYLLIFVLELYEAIAGGGSFALGVVGGSVVTTLFLLVESHDVMDVCESHTILVRCIRSRLGISPTYGICHLLLQFIYVFHPYHTAFLKSPHSLVSSVRQLTSSTIPLLHSSVFRTLYSLQLPPGKYHVPNSYSDSSLVSSRL